MLFEMIKVNYFLEIQKQENLLRFFFLKIKPILSTYVNSHMIYTLGFANLFPLYYWNHLLKDHFLLSSVPKACNKGI